jgi:integrase/recombinase XerD
MKVDRHGKAKILTLEEIQLLFREGFQTNRDRALFGICLFSACRINEAVTLKTVDAYDTAGRVRPKLIIRKGNTKYFHKLLDSVSGDLGRESVFVSSSGNL